MANDDQQQESYIALGLFTVLIGIFLVFPWFIPGEWTIAIFGLPAWYWLTFGVMTLLYVIYFLFTMRIDAFYALFEVGD